VPEDVRGHRPVGVVAHVALDEAHARELVLPLAEVEELCARDVLLHHDRVERVVRALVDLARDLGRRHFQHLAETLQHLVAALLREVRGPELDRDPRRVPDEDAPLAIADHPARRLDSNRAQLVVLRSAEVLVAGEDLERPEPQEQHDEHAERDRTEDRQPQRELRRQPVRLDDARVRREEAAG
jgi:hypothetical protein